MKKNLFLRKLFCFLLAFAFLFLVTSVHAFAINSKAENQNQVQPQQKITGTVIDDSGTPLPGASVKIKGTINGTITDVNGNYKLTVTNIGKPILVFTFIGYEQVEIPLQNKTVINATLANKIVSFDEVVVTALGISREAKSLSYAQQNVDVETMNETKSTNIVNSLSGKIAGVQVVPAGFNTGSSRIIIRGNRSLTGNNQPLFVVDGLPIDNSAGDAGSIDYGSGANDLNTENIASISILKGPNAAALYGSRAANGVVLITTKKGSSGFKVTVNSSTMFQTLTEYPEYQNAYGVGTSFYIDNTHMLPYANVNYRSWGSPMLGQPYVALNGETKPYLPQPNNVKSFYQTARLFTNSVILEGGNLDNNVRFGYTNYNGTSVVDGFNNDSKHDLNLRLQNRFTKWMTLDSKVNFIRDLVTNRQYSNSNGRNPAYMYVQMARSTDLNELTPWKDPLTGKEIGTHRNFSNPYWVINENPNQDTKDRLISSVNAEIIVTDWLKLIGRVGADIYWRNGYEFNNIGSIIASNPDGFLRTFNTAQQNINLEGLASINKKFKNFSLVATLGVTRFDSKYENRETRINSLLQPGLINLSNAKEYPIVSQNISRKRLNSVYGAASIGYKNFAYIDITGRNDLSSTLPSQNNSYFYPSIGGTFLITDFLKMKSKFLSFAKVRASYAIVGNDADPYQLSQTYSFNGLFNNATVASVGTTMNNPDLKPEKTTSFETGFDLRFFDNLLSIDGTYYNSSTLNQIISASLPTSSGYIQRLYNAGEIQNWGYELSMTGKILNKGKLKWESRINFSKNNSLVVSLKDSITRFQLANSSSYLYVYAEVGKPYAFMRGLGVKRDAQGRMLIEDGGGLLQKVTDMPLGSATPDWLAGFSNTFSYKGFDLYTLLDVKIGGKIYSRTISMMLTNGMTAETLQGRDAFYLRSVIWGESTAELTGGARWDAWFSDGTQNLKYMTPQNYEYARPNFADFVMYDASYVKLREVSIGYTLPSRLLTKTLIKGARFSITGRNLLLLYSNTPHGIDPEATSTSGNGQGIENGSLPPNAIYGFNIRLQF